MHLSLDKRPFNVYICRDIRAETLIFRKTSFFKQKLSIIN